MAVISQSLIFALRTVFVSFNFYQLVSYTEQILLIKNAIIRRRLQFEGADMDTLLRLERQMQDSMQNKIKQTSIAEYFA